MKISCQLPQKISVNKFYNFHWGQKKRVVDTYHKAFLEWRNERIKEFPVEITYIFTFKSKPLDSTNCFSMVKATEDALVKMDILPDDSPKYVAGTHVFSQKGNKDWLEVHIL